MGMYDNIKRRAGEVFFFLGSAFMYHQAMIQNAVLPVTMGTWGNTVMAMKSPTVRWLTTTEKTSSFLISIRNLTPTKSETGWRI